jgi:hypothetical protein
MCTKHCYSVHELQYYKEAYICDYRHFHLTRVCNKYSDASSTWHASVGMLVDNGWQNWSIHNLSLCLWAWVLFYFEMLKLLVFPLLDIAFLWRVSDDGVQMPLSIVKFNLTTSYCNNKKYIWLQTFAQGQMIRGNQYWAGLTLLDDFIRCGVVLILIIKPILLCGFFIYN